MYLLCKMSNPGERGRGGGGGGGGGGEVSHVQALPQDPYRYSPYLVICLCI